MNQKPEEIKALQQLVRDLWAFVENQGDTEEFFILRERVRGMK